MAQTIIKRVGGKVKMSNWIKKKLPAHSVYCEPFGGSFAVGLCLPKPDGSNYRIVYNDLDRHVWNLFRVLRENSKDLIEQVELTPYSRAEFENAVAFIEGGSCEKANPVEWARCYIVYNRQSFSGKETGDWCISRHGENISNTWSHLPPLMRAVAMHLKTAFVECLDYRELLPKWDSEQTTFYLDPPYLDVEKDFYHVNKEEGFSHTEMRKSLENLQGSWAVSYYDSEEIRDLYKGYKFHELKVKKHMQTKAKKDEATEVLIVRENEWASKRSAGEADCFD